MISRDQNRIFEKPILIIFNWINLLSSQCLATLKQRLNTIINKCPQLKLLITSVPDFRFDSRVKFSEDRDFQLSFQEIKRSNTMGVVNPMSQLQGYRLYLPLLSPRQAKLLLEFQCQTLNQNQLSDDQL
jgi:hypothetical protein